MNKYEVIFDVELTMLVDAENEAEAKRLVREELDYLVEQYTFEAVDDFEVLKVTRL